ncbi:MAG: hypothetical protein Ct9H300mP29_7980 [Candidatus Neomarinimicrobiota bacterium]|nr:MAG: hypothetical protein Ct9H300mP29_7980 [Candidatus Neomarinimicrobiota bacterium]
MIEQHFLLTVKEKLLFKNALDWLGLPYNYFE